MSSKTSSQRSGRVSVLRSGGMGGLLIKLSTRAGLVLGAIDSI